MASTGTSTSHRPREWRRKVSLPARVRNGPGWANGHILNISSRGLLLQYGGPLAVGSIVELRKDEQAIVAQVVWREGSRAGLSSPNPLPVADLIPPATAASLEGSGAQAPRPSRRVARYRHEESRWFGRKLEFIAVIAIAVLIAIWVSVMAAMVLFKPLASAVAVL